VVDALLSHIQTEQLRSKAQLEQQQP